MIFSKETHAFYVFLLFYTKQIKSKECSLIQLNFKLLEKNQKVHFMKHTYLKKIFIAFGVILSVHLTAQKESSFKIPKQYSLEFGYRNVFSVIDRTNILPENSATNGYGFLFDYAWQLGGLTGKKPAIFLSVPIGYTVLLPDNYISQRASMLNYGWAIRHELAKNKVFTPFVGYGLFLNTLKIQGVEGGIMGHQTQFDLGTNFNTSSKLKLFAKIQYSYTSYPKPEHNKRLHYQYFDVRVGVRY